MLPINSPTSSYKAKNKENIKMYFKIDVLKDYIHCGIKVANNDKNKYLARKIGHFHAKKSTQQMRDAFNNVNILMFKFCFCFYCIVYYFFKCATKALKYINYMI